MKKKTHEEYVAELAIKNPNLEVLENYINSTTKIMHRCLKHNICWKTIPSRALRGIGCEKCHSEKISMSKYKYKSTDDYILDVNNISPHIDVLEEYIDLTTPILHFCKKHNVEWKALPDSILRGHGCMKCGVEKVREQTTKTHAQYISELKEINLNIDVIEEYKGANTPILHKCLLDDYEWYATPANILSGKGCPKCGGNIKKTHEEYAEEVSLINPNIKVLGKYITARMPILHKCKIHNTKWIAYPYHILQGCGCAECGKEKISSKNSKTHEQYVAELKKINPNIIPIEMYINSNISILHKCLIDGNEWYSYPSNILAGSGCPQCNESRGERKIRLWLENNCILYESQKTFKNCYDKKPLPFDFYLPELNKCIEYDGIQHYEPIEFFGGQENFEYVVKHDNIKNEYCKNNGISLLRIPYFKNVEEELHNFLFI